MSIRPLYASEKLLKGFVANGMSAGPPYRGCGISSDFHGTMLATDNEAGQNKYARQMGQGGRTVILQRGWRAFAMQTPPDSNGWVDMGDIPLIHKAMFPDLPQPVQIHAAPARVWELIGENALSIAIHTGAVNSADAIRKYVNAVPHQVVAWKKKTINGVRWVKIIDPMHAPSDLYTGHWVKWTSLKRCGLAIQDANGGIFGFRFPVGGWTEMALRDDAMQRTIDRVRGQRDEALDIVKDQRTKILTLEQEVGALTAQLLECRDDRCDAEVEAFADLVIDAVAALKTDLNE